VGDLRFILITGHAPGKQKARRKGDLAIVATLRTAKADLSREQTRFR
jgi:hypothetical protein